VQALRAEVREHFPGASFDRHNPNYNPNASSIYSGINSLSRDTLRNVLERKEAKRKEAERKQSKRRKR
jgi:hypothetical protein